MEQTSVATAPTTFATPYWDAVRGDVQDSDMSWRPGRMIGGIKNWQPTAKRMDMSSQFAWTVSDPATVAFVVEHVGPRVIDPLAGTGYWAWLLGQHGIDVAASDAAPPDSAENHYHRAGKVFVPVAQADAVEAVTAYAQDRILLLSWPPYAEPIGAQILDAYRGDRFVFIGEGDGGCCGDEAMWTTINDGWREVVYHMPVQWCGMHDFVTVYERGAES